MKALVGAFNQEKALVGAFSVIVQPVVEPIDRFTALILGQQMKKAQDLFIAVVIMSVLALVIGVAAHMGAGSNSTKYEVDNYLDKMSQ